jgi:cholest-4-en-3-one 26-monooxygenase
VSAWEQATVDGEALDIPWLGANLARLELRVLFEELLRAAPGFRLAPGRQPEFAPGYFTRTRRELWVEFSPD